MATLRDLIEAMTGTGWNPDVPTSGVSHGYGLAGARVQPMAGSGYERTLAPGELRSGASLRDMLGEVILAAGSGAVPGVSGKGAARRPGGRRNIPPGTGERHFEMVSPLVEALAQARPPEPGKWRNYGTEEGARFELQRGPSNRARWIDRTTGLQIGPTQGNIAPAMAWGLNFGLEEVGTGKGPRIDE